MQALGEGPGKAAGWIAAVVSSRMWDDADIQLTLSLLCRFCLFEADPSPALRAAPFSKGARFYRVVSLERNNCSM